MTLGPSGSFGFGLDAWNHRINHAVNLYTSVYSILDVFVYVGPKTLLCDTRVYVHWVCLHVCVHVLCVSVCIFKNKYIYSE